MEQGHCGTCTAEVNGDLQTLICVLVAKPRWCLTLLNPVPWQNWMAAYLGYSLRMKTVFPGWPIMVHDTHTRRRRLTVCTCHRFNAAMLQICVIFGHGKVMQNQCRKRGDTLDCCAYQNVSALSCAIFEMFDILEDHDLEVQVRGHSPCEFVHDLYRVRCGSNFLDPTHFARL